MPVAIRQFLREALRLRWRSYRKSLGHCRRRVSEESIHELRVESRRLLATLELFADIVAPRKLEAARRVISKTLHSLGEVRDVQVQLAAADGLCGRFPELSGLRRRLEKRERRLRKEVAATLSRRTRGRLDETMTKIHRALRKAPSRGEREQADRVTVMSGLAAARDAAKARFAAIETQSPATIHEARVALKRLRYLVEVLRPIVPGFTSKRIRQLRGPQDRMGRVQDTTLFRATVEAYLSEHATQATRASRILSLLDRRKAASVARFMRQDGGMAGRAGFRRSFRWLFTAGTFESDSPAPGARALTLHVRNTNVT